MYVRARACAHLQLCVRVRSFAFVPTLLSFLCPQRSSSLGVYCVEVLYVGTACINVHLCLNCLVFV